MHHYFVCVSYILVLWLGPGLSLIMQIIAARRIAACTEALVVNNKRNAGC